jgi:DNA-binding CsgD family transcriptional regulator
VVVDKSATSCAILSIIRDERAGPVDDAMRQRTALLAPHIRRAVLVGKAIDHKTAEAETFAESLDAVSAGIFLVGADGRLMHANAAGRALLAAGKFLTARGGRLLASGRTESQWLETALLAATGRDPQSPSRAQSIPLASADGEQRVAHVLPLAGGAAPRVAATRATAAVIVHRAGLKSPSAPEMVAKAYGLTPTELNVLLAIVEIGGVPEVAEALGVASTTVKTHLGHLYAKTGTARQADLVKLIAGFASPLLN